MDALKFAVILLLICMFSPVAPAMAQTSLVPVHHPVYDWLYHQRVAGNLPHYAYETLPLQRNEILGYLRKLEDSESLRGNQVRTLHSYLREFDEQTINPVGGHTIFMVQDSLNWRSAQNATLRQRLWNDDEKHAAMIRYSDGFVIIDAGLGLRLMHVDDAGQRFFDPLALMTHFRSYGRLGDNLGMHIEMRRANPVINYQPYNYDPFYTYNEVTQYNLRTDSKSEGDNYSNFHGSATYSPIPSIALSIGRGNLKVGTGTNDNLLFSRNAYPLDWIRIDLGWSTVKYQMIHGTLGWQNREVIDPNNPLFVTKNAPQRFVRQHSFTARPLHNLQITAFEMINYGNRGMEVAYLNPFNLMYFAEQELRDQDNAMIGGSLVYRPLRRVELFTEIVIDDWRGPGDLIMKKKFPEVSRFGRRYGLQFVPAQNMRLYTEYIRLDPFVYSHPYALNAHTNNGFSLAAQLPSNSDRISVGGRLSGYRNTWLDMSLHQVRNGRDILSDDGTILFSSGWDVNVGRTIYDLPESYLFLDGDPHQWVELKVDASWEIQRAWILSGRFEQRWMQ